MIHLSDGIKMGSGNRFESSNDSRDQRVVISKRQGYSNS